MRYSLSTKTKAMKIKFKQQHTPGPWERVDISTGTATKREQLNYNGYAALQIAHDGSEEGEANAQLAATAPELLQCVATLLSLTGSRGEFLDMVKLCGDPKSEEWEGRTDAVHGAIMYAQDIAAKALSTRREL